MTYDPRKLYEAIMAGSQLSDSQKERLFSVYLYGAADLFSHVSKTVKDQVGDGADEDKAFSAILTYPATLNEAAGILKAEIEKSVKALSELQNSEKA